MPIPFKIGVKILENDSKHQLVEISIITNHNYANDFKLNQFLIRVEPFDGSNTEEIVGRFQTVSTYPNVKLYNCFKSEFEVSAFFYLAFIRKNSLILNLRK